jgi:hypothetical protein
VAGHPFGQTAGYTFGDAPLFWYPLLWSFGGKEIDADSKTVVLNSKETVESVKFGVGYWNDCCDPGGPPGTIRATIVPSFSAPSAQPTTAHRAISRPRRSPTST